MRLHTLFAALLIPALASCDDASMIVGDRYETVVAKGPSSLRFTHEGHELIVTVGSVVARRYGNQDISPVYKAPYAVTGAPVIFDKLMILTCRVYDKDGQLVGGSGISVARAPEGGLFTLELARDISNGKLVCEAANGRAFDTTLKQALER